MSNTHDTKFVVCLRTDEYPEGYYVTDDLTDHAISMVRERKASNPEKPFFLYFAHGAVHAPSYACETETCMRLHACSWDVR